MSDSIEVKYGDVWQIGEHRLMCGDSTDPAMMEAFLGDIKPSLCVTDPPYGIQYQSKVANDLRHPLIVKNDHIANWSAAFSLSRAPVLYTWFSFLHADVVLRALKDAGYSPKQTVVWVKNRFSLQRHLYHLQHEQCYVSLHNTAKVSQCWLGDRKQSSVWNIDGVPSTARIHPSQKPTELYERAIINHTRPNDYVIDPFAGSGTVINACTSTKRRAIAIECCPDLCSRILYRARDSGAKLYR